MKKYKKVEMVAKNAPSGSYSAGCPAKDRGYNDANKWYCLQCERTV